MKLPAIKPFQQGKGTVKPHYVTISVQAADEQQAKEMQEAIQSFVSHFSVAEMKSAAQKLKSATNRKLIKTFL